MPKHAAGLDAANMTSRVTGRARYAKRATNCEGHRSFDWASILFHYPTTWLYSGARCTTSHFSVFSQTWRPANRRPTSLTAETVRFQEQTLLVMLRACLTLLLPGEPPAVQWDHNFHGYIYTVYDLHKMATSELMEGTSCREELKRKRQRYPFWTGRKLTTACSTHFPYVPTQHKCSSGQNME